MLNKIFIAGKTFEELMALFFCDIKGDDGYYDIISYHIACEYQSQLEGMLHLLSAHRLRGALCGLSLAAEKIGKSPALAKYLNHPDEMVVSEAIDGLRHSGANEWEQISPFLKHHSSFVQGAALRYCRAALGNEAKPYLLAALNAPCPRIKENALDELEGIADLSIADVIKKILLDSTNPEAVRQAAETLLISIQR